MSEPYTAEQAHAAVARGAAWLDRRMPGWVSAINVYKLDLNSADHCILGQTAGELIPVPVEDDVSVTPYEAAVRHFAPVAQTTWAARYGFNLPALLTINPYSDRASREYPIYYEMLTIAWKELIRERLAVSA